MPKVVLTAQVQEPGEWEGRFRTHVDVLRTYALQAPVQYAISGNEVAVCFDSEDLDQFKRALESQATAEAMAFDGVKRETVKMFILDKNLELK